MRSRLTEAQKRVLRSMEKAARVRFEQPDAQEVVCHLNAMGLAIVYTDSGNSLGLVVGAITPEGRAALKAAMEARDT